MGIRSLTCSTLGVEGRLGTLGWVLGWMTSRSIIHTNQTSWLMHSWNIFGARTNHGHTWIHKIHHGLDLKEATTFPLILFLMINHGGYIQMSFCPKTPKLGVPKFLKLGFSALWSVITSCANFLLRWGLKKKLYPLSRAFQQHVIRHLHASKSGWFSTFNGRESN